MKNREGTAYHDFFSLQFRLRHISSSFPLQGIPYSASLDADRFQKFTARTKRHIPHLSHFICCILMDKQKEKQNVATVLLHNPSQTQGITKGEIKRQQNLKQKPKMQVSLGLSIIKNTCYARLVLAAITAISKYFNPLLTLQWRLNSATDGCSTTEIFSDSDSHPPLGNQLHCLVFLVAIFLQL